MDSNWINTSVKKQFREMILAILLPAVPLLVTLVFEAFVDSKALFTVSRNEAELIEWSNQSPIPAGDYYISVGRPQGSCSLNYGAEVLASNAGIGLSERSSVFLGAPLVVSGASKKIWIMCKKTQGSPVRLIHTIVVGSYRTTKLLHMIRFLVDQILPISFILFFLSIAYVSRYGDVNFTRNVFVTGAITILYLLSLGNTPRVLFPNLEAIYLHAILKTLTLLCVLVWQAERPFLRIYFVLVSGGLIVLFSSTFLFWPHRLFQIYGNCLHIFPLFILFVAVASAKDLAPAIAVRSIVMLLPIFTSNIIDVVTIFYRTSGAFFSPVSTVSIFSLALLHRLRLQRAQNRAVRSTATWSVLQAEERPLADKMQVIGEELAANTSLPRWSIYLDSFSLGYASRPRTELRRLVSSQQHEHAADPLIRLNGSAPFGALMRRALETDSVITERSPNDNCLYVVIPILGLGCINLRGTEPSQGDERYLREYIDHIAQQLRLVVPAMVRADDPSTLASSLLREELGPGVHQVNYGAIFADAVGYTQNTHISPHFVEFFQFEYIPALLRSLGPSVLLKDVFGDELFLIVREPKLATPAVAGSLVSSSSVENLTLEAVKRLQQFVADEGRELCTAAGYQAIEFKVGSHAGPGQISILGPDVTIVGPSIEAKRCLGRSRPSQPFISKYLYIHLPESLKPHAVHEIYAAKKEILEGYRVSFGF